jgi:hypothetical protein
MGTSLVESKLITLHSSLSTRSNALGNGLNDTLLGKASCLAYCLLDGVGV